MKQPIEKRIDAQGRRLCSAHTTSGNLCRGPAILGGSVCRVHGGGAPQVKAAAASVILEQLIGPALDVVRDLMLDTSQPGSVRLTAVRIVLDRAPELQVEIDLESAMRRLDREIQRLEAELSDDEASAGV